jgi:predicted HTH transcriptional regulator
MGKFRVGVLVDDKHLAAFLRGMNNAPVEVEGIAALPLIERERVPQIEGPKRKPGRKGQVESIILEVVKTNGKATAVELRNALEQIGFSPDSVQSRVALMEKQGKLTRVKNAKPIAYELGANANG